jgi:hypothetical protein
MNAVRPTCPQISTEHPSQPNLNACLGRAKSTSRTLHSSREDFSIDGDLSESPFMGHGVSDSRGRATRFFAFLMLLIGLGGVCSAQTNPNTDNGVKPFGSYDAASIDTIDLATGALSLHIPLLSYPQRGNFPAIKYSIAFGSKALYINPHCVMEGSTNPSWQEPICSPHWQPVTIGNGVNMILPAQNVSLSKLF